MEEPEGERVSEKIFEPEKLTTIGPDKTAERKEIQEAIQRSKVFCLLNHYQTRML